MTAPVPGLSEVEAVDEIPDYLKRLYWWAYVHPRAVRVFERQWLVNLILWGNFARLRDAALTALGSQGGARTLQVACVYGDLTERLLASVPAGGRLDVVDVLPVQLHNLDRKIRLDDRLVLHRCDARALVFENDAFDRVLIFFLLHEQPGEVRRATLAEAVRVLRPGGRLVLVDYDRPRRMNPLRPFMRLVLGALEPYALDLWRRNLASWLPQGVNLRIRKRGYFGGLYQKLVIDRV